MVNKGRQLQPLLQKAMVQTCPLKQGTTMADDVVMEILREYKRPSSLWMRRPKNRLPHWTAKSEGSTRL